MQIMDGLTSEERAAALGNVSIGVRLHSTPGCGVLTGNLVAPLVGDTATFTDLNIKGGGAGYILRFCVEPCRDNTFLLTDDVFSDEFSMRSAVLQVEQHPSECYSREEFLVQPIVRILTVKHDRMGKPYAVRHREYKFSVTASFNMPGVTLYGRRTVWPTGGEAHWTDLRLDVSGYAELGANFRLVFTTCYGEPECSADGGLIDDQMASAVSHKFDVEHGDAASLLILQQPVSGYTGMVIGATCTQMEGSICVRTDLRRPPRIQLADVSDNVVLTGNWFACVRLQKANSTSDDINYYMTSLRGDVQVKVSDGIAVFTNLDIALAAQGYFFNFSVFSGVASASRNCQAPAESAFATAVSDYFKVDYTWASQILPMRQPGSQLGAQGYRLEIGGASMREEVLTQQPTAAFADPDDNILTLAHCESDDTGNCNMNIGIRISNVSEEDSLWPSGSIYAGCHLSSNAFTCKPETSVFAVPKHGVATFTDIALLRVGTYVLQFFSGTLTVNAEPFYVGSGRASRIYAHISPRDSSCKYASLTCRKGGTLTPQPVFKVRDKWQNIAQDGSFLVRVACKNLHAQEEGLLTCGNCNKRASSDLTCLSCDAYSSKGYVTFLDIAVTSMRTDLVLEATLPDLTLSDFVLMGYEQGYEAKASTLSFDTFGVQSIKFDNRPGPTPSGCPIFPPPTISLIGNSPHAPPEDAQLMTPIAQGLADVFALKCTEQEPDVEDTIAGTTHSIPHRVSVTSVIRGKFERDVSMGAYFNGRPYYKGEVGTLYEEIKDGSPRAVGEGENYYLYYCDANSTRNFFGGGDEVAGCGSSFWALGMLAHYCEDGTVGIEDYKVDKAFYHTCDAAFLPTKIVEEWRELIRRSDASSARAFDEKQLGTYDILFQKVTPACTIDKTLYGATSVQIVDGAAVFHNLRLNATGTYNLRFNLRLFGSEAVQSMDVSYRIIVNALKRPVIIEDPYNVAVGTVLSVRSRVRDTLDRPLGS